MSRKIGGDYRQFLNKIILNLQFSMASIPITPIIYILLFLFALLYSKAALFWLYLWQLKEYRMDRFLSEFGFLGKLLHFWIFSGGRKFHRPVFTVKAFLIYVISLFAVLGGIYLILKGYFYGVIFGFWFIIFGLLALYFLVPFIVVATMFIFQIPIRAAKFFIYKMAAARVSSAKNLIVIGITGSYGKTSTKEFLSQILEQKFKVRKTPKNINTEIGVAKFVLQKLESDDEVLVAEMGAYKKGEIKRLCDIVKPRIGIVTGINEQHMDLFKSFENIIATKYELIESLPEDGAAFFNGENKYCLEMAEKWQGYKTIYGSTEGKQGWELAELPSHYLQNLAGAIEVARYLGMDEDEITGAAKNIKLSERMTQIFIGKDGALIIDDTYSANPAGVLAALDYLAEQKQNYKIIIMPCLIELGEAAEDIHRRIGKRINEVCDLAVITTKDYFDIIKQEAGEKAVLCAAPKKVMELLKDRLNSDAAVLVEGRVAQGIVGFLK